MIGGCRFILAILLTFAALAGRPAVANQIGDDGADRILIANPSPALRAHLSSNGYRMESTERLEALDLSLMIVLPPRHVSATAAVDDLQPAFPKALIALDNAFYLAQDSRRV